MAGQIVAGRTPNVKTTTCNLAELVAFTRALQWAHQHARGKAVCVRYGSEYASRISTGAWKPKKHKEMAEEARRAWAQLKQANGERTWMRHSKSRLHIAAQKLATRGKGGEHVLEYMLKRSTKFE